MSDNSLFYNNSADNICNMQNLVEHDESDFSLLSYDFNLPEELIAQEPCEQRGQSRLLVFERARSELHDVTFNDISEFLPSGSLLVANNVKVAPLRLPGYKDSGGKFEFLLLTPLPAVKVLDFEDKQQAEVHGLLRGVKKIKLGARLRFGEDFHLVLLEKMDFGRCRVLLEWSGVLSEKLEKYGRLPLPPYIRRELADSDKERYQTIFAASNKLGAAAAPTAGLHFTPELREELTLRGHQWAELSLYVGYGTFSPVRTEDIRQHTMHSELIELDEQNAAIINEAKSSERPIVAVGTTSARSLEGIWQKTAALVPYSGETDIFIYPGRPLNVVNHLLTNFHLPQSSLLMLVSAMTGRKRLLSIYEEAIKKRYRFFSYGDAMLIL